MPSPPGFVPPCIPTLAAKPWSGPEWIHEIKHDGYRLQVRRDGDAVRLFTRRGYDWTERYPAIAAAAAKLKARTLTVDGEAVVCDGDGVAVFGALHRRQRASDAFLYASDLLELDGEDLRAKSGAAVFRHACRMGLEGIVSKRLTAPYRSGRSSDWLKVKNPDSPAMVRAREAEW
jgi:bifunctional non-homologous end joining protein LigD